MPARHNIATYVYDSHGSHYKSDLAKGAKNGVHSITTAINNIIWPSEPAATAESATIDQFSSITPAIVSEDTTITQLSTTTTSGIDMSNINNTVMDIITNGTQDVINQFSTSMPAAATDGAITIETITQLSTTTISGIDTSNVNNTVMDIITNGTQDAMVNVVNNVVNVTNEISSPTTSANVIQNAVTSMVNLVDTTSSTVTASANITNQVPTIPPTESTSATIANVVKNTTTLVTDTISSTAKTIGSEYFKDHENEGSQKGTNALLVLILLVLIFIGAFLIYIYIRHKKMGKTQHKYEVNRHEENPSTTELQHEQIEIENETYVQHTAT